jgi:uncharacterized protein (DUF58 family)
LAVKELKLELNPRIRKVTLRARIDVLNKVLEGNWNTYFKGQGLEFAGFRAYTFSDDASKIDWGASLRAHEILVRDLEEFHNFNVFFLLDVSNSMLFSSTGKLKAEYAAELTFSLCHAVMQAGDAIGLGMFNDKLITRIPPALGKGVYYRISRELMNSKNYGGNFDLTKVLQYVSSFLQDRSVIIIISDFIGMKDNWNRYLQMLAGRYDVIGMMVRDPRDSEMPDTGGQFLVEDPYSNNKMFIDSRQYAKIYSEFTKKDEEFVRHSFEKAKLGFVSLRTDEDFQQPVIDYFRKRMALTR